MDDALEIPSSDLKNVPTAEEPQDDQNSDDEEGGLDWTKLLPASARPVIPKRGEKEFEPRGAGGTNLQQHVLDRSRSAMFETLKSQRTISSKSVSYGTWYPSLGRTHVTTARGIHFSNMGHSAPRSVLGEDGVSKVQKRLELLPEEALYLIERGSLFCWYDRGTEPRIPDLPKDVDGTPMSVQQAFTEMIGRDGLTLEKFQVYSYLKRLGYVVTRTDPPDSYYPIPSDTGETSTHGHINLPVFTSIYSFLTSSISNVLRIVMGSMNWWKPIRIGRLWCASNKSYASLYRSLRFMPAGHNIPLNTRQPSEPTSPYKLFFNLYKPSTPFKKSAPPPPDFQIVVVNARTTPMPTLQELTNLFDQVPESPLPAPRPRRNLQPEGKEKSSPSETPTTPLKADVKAVSILQRFFLWFSPQTPKTEPTEPVRRINPFMALKTGKKIVIIAAVDTGNISFFRFGQGEFTEWSMA
ncbi:hypothetical protein CVT24_008796 [Panaeolus cyanescens]|uniref:tRNA-splicing endonuclease subunit Sen54 N-terminal domain-containing protein n=1 Tax=Panaeolus cyanescens TaxID=181874 RepID=A0A409VB40_9AGAR|nr:hypothetical protein CVT24_008796 [Panaeolus cyanescens]